MSGVILQGTITKYENSENEDQGFMRASPVLGPVARDPLFLTELPLQTHWHWMF